MHGLRTLALFEHVSYVDQALVQHSEVSS